MKLENASQGVLGLLAGLGTGLTPPPRTSLNRCIVTVHKDAVLPDTLVKLCRVVAMDTLIPPIDALHLPSLCTTNVCCDNKCKKMMKLGLLHSVILQHWMVVKGERIAITINMVTEDTAELDERDLTNFLIEVVYNSIIETEKDAEFLKCLAEQIFTHGDHIVLDGNTVPLPEPADWDTWVEEHVPITLASVGLTESVIKDKLITRNIDMLKKLSSVLHVCKIAQTSKLSQSVTVQKRIVKLMEVIPPAIPASVHGGNIVGGKALYNYWLTQELEQFSTTRDVISSQLKALHMKLVQGLTTLSPQQVTVYNAIYEDKPPKDWLYQNIHGSDLTLEQWLKVLTEGQQQLIRLHEGGSGMWLGSIANLPVLLQTLIHDKANEDGTSPSTVTLRISLLDTIPAADRIQMVVAKGGILVTGLQLVRAGWDMASGTLEDDFSGFSAPLAHIYPSSDPVEGECYMCPLYIDENIRTPVALFPMASTLASSHWTLLSVCLTVVRNRISLVGSRPKIVSSPVSSSLFQLQSKANLLCSKQLIRSSSLSVPTPRPLATQRSVSMTPTASIVMSPNIPNRLQPTPPSNPRSRRTSIASQILERKSKSSSRGNSPKLESPLVDMQRRKSMTRQTPPVSPSHGSAPPTSPSSPARGPSDPLDPPITATPITATARAAASDAIASAAVKAAADLNLAAQPPTSLSLASDEEFGDGSIPVSPASTVVISREGSEQPSPAATPTTSPQVAPKSEIPLVSITPQLHIDSTPPTAGASAEPVTYAEPVTGTSTKPEVIESESEHSPIEQVKSSDSRNSGKAASPAVSQRSVVSKGKASPAVSSKSVISEGKASPAKSVTSKKSVKGEVSPAVSRSGSRGSVTSKTSKTSKNSKNGNVE